MWVLYGSGRFSSCYVYWNKRIGIFAWYSYLILGRCILSNTASATVTLLRLLRRHKIAWFFRGLPKIFSVVLHVDAPS